MFAMCSVQIMDRHLKAPRPTQCVSFKLNPSGPTDVPWQGQMYVMYPRAVYQSTLTATQQSFLGRKFIQLDRHKAKPYEGNADPTAFSYCSCLGQPGHED